MKVAFTMDLTGEYFEEHISEISEEIILKTKIGSMITGLLKIPQINIVEFSRTGFTYFRTLCRYLPCSVSIGA